MTETVTTAADLDALPLGSIVVDPYAATCVRSRVSDPEMPSDWVRVTVAVKGGEHHHRPFLPAEVIRRGWAGYTDAEPVPVKPSREDVARVIVNHSGHLGTHYMDMALAAADAVLALLPGRAVEEVKAEALEESASVYDVAQISGVFFGAAEYPKAWLRARAASLRGESND